jgi:aryl-alcohol dehydrogenase-like predicted oxidoreductase
MAIANELPLTSTRVQELAQAIYANTTPASTNGLPMRELGRTGERVSILCLGGWHIGAAGYGQPLEPEAIEMMHMAIDEGVNFFDNAWDYNDGFSEEVMGRALAMDGKRNKVFLMTKNCERDYEGSMRDLEDSLRRLQTDHLDLWQFHEINYDNDPDWIFERGAMRAALEAQQAGKVRFIGFTGHKDPRIHLKMLKKPHKWDVSLMPINAMDALYRSFLEEVVPVCHDMGVGPMGMKALGGGYPQGSLVENGILTVEEGYRFALSQPIASQVMGIKSLEQLKENIAMVRAFVPMTVEEQSTLLARVYEPATDGRFETFKSTNAHDGPHHRKQHGFKLA